MTTVTTIPAAAMAPATSATALTQGTPASGDDQQITLEVRYAEGEEAVIPEVISQFGRDYRLINTSDPVEEESLPQTRTYTYRVSGLLTAEQIADTRGLGDVRLTPVMGSRVTQVERDEVLTGQATNDIDDLPLYKRYEESSATSPGATVTGELKLAEASFTVSGKDQYGLPNRYTAATVYRGSETTNYTAYYAAEATYRRSVTEDGNKTYVLVATYVPDFPIPAEEPVPLEGPGPLEAPGEAAEEIVLADIGGNPGPLAALWASRNPTEKIALLAGTAVILAAVILFLAFLRRRKQPPKPPRIMTTLCSCKL
jgi:hypothetical protein